MSWSDLRVESDIISGTFPIPRLISHHIMNKISLIWCQAEFMEIQINYTFLHFVRIEIDNADQPIAMIIRGLAEAEDVWVIDRVEMNVFQLLKCWMSAPGLIE